MTRLTLQKSACAASRWLALALTALPFHAQAETFHTDTVFHGTYAGPGPYEPAGSLAADAQGRLYGTTQSGGTGGLGTVYRLTPGKLRSDPWALEVLHNFTGPDGNSPAAGVTLDASGAVYGTTFDGGASGLGVAFRLDTTPGWPITVLHDFGAESDGIFPNSDLTPGDDGRLYGTTFRGGLTNAGTVFALSPQGDSVSYTVVYSFDFDTGGNPTAFSMQQDGALAVIGTLNDKQAVIRLTEKTGVWSSLLIYSLTRHQDQLLSLLTGPHDVLYLCSERNDTGFAIQLSPPTGPGAWIENDLYAFTSPTSGCTSLTIDPSGGFLGTSSTGGTKTHAGDVFSLVPQPSGTGAYALRMVHRFSDSYEIPSSPLLRLGGLYYGSTGRTGRLGGTVFDLRP